MAFPTTVEELRAFIIATIEAHDPASTWSVQTYNMHFYLRYLAKWPEYCFHVHGPHEGRPMGYVLGKAEGVNENWHGHVTAVTVPPEYRRLGVSTRLMGMLERVSEWE